MSCKCSWSRYASRRRALPGIDADRADVLLGGALIFQVLSEAFDIREWTVSMVLCGLAC